MKRLKDVYRCVLCGGDMQVIKFDKEEKKVYYRCERCGYEETLSFEEAGIDDEDYAFFILKDDRHAHMGVSRKRIKTENADEIEVFTLLQYRAPLSGVL